MALTLADIDRWDESSIRDVASALAKRGASAQDVRTGLARLPLISSWQGAGGDAARASLDKLSAYLAAHGEEMARVSSAACSSADEIEGLKSMLHRIYDDASAQGFSIDPISGTVTPTNDALFGDPLYALQQADLEVRIQELLAAAEAADAGLAQAIATAGGHANPAGDRPSVEDALAQPVPEDPTQFRDFWNELTPEQRGALFQRDPTIANNVGMPGVDRDYYNRQRLPTELAQAQAAQASVEALEAEHPDWANGENIPPVGRNGRVFGLRETYQEWKREYSAAQGASKYLFDLQAVDNAVRDKPGRMLLLLDTKTGEQAHAAIAVGNPDTADHVSVTTPGLNTTVHGAMEGMVDEARRVRTEALDQLLFAGRGGDSVSTIAWIGYDAPQTPGGEDLRAALAGGWDVGHDILAAAGAQDLARFYDGLNATHQGPLNLTAIGHSYGSLTTGMALQVPGDHGVDNALFYGSPGIHATTPGDLGLPNGHVFTMQTPDDPIQQVYDAPPIARAVAPLLPHPLDDLAQSMLTGMDASGTGAFGPNPATNPNFTHLATGEVSLPDGRALGAASGHSDYPRWDAATNQPYTTGYNIAAVIAGTTPVPQK